MHRLPLRPLLNATRRLTTSNSVRFYARASSRGPPPGQPRVEPNLQLDPADILSPSEYIAKQVDTSAVQKVVENFNQDDQETFAVLVDRLTKENGHSDLLAMSDLADFFKAHGVDLNLPEKFYDPRLIDPREYPDFPDEPQYAELAYRDENGDQLGNTVRSILHSAPYLDMRNELVVPRSKKTPYGGRIIERNTLPIFDLMHEAERNGKGESGSTSSSDESSRAKAFPLPMSMIRNLYQSILISRVVKQQTGKGKIARRFFLVCVGNGNGLVGYGQGKDKDGRVALQKARLAAVKSMDYVDRFESRTVWTEMYAKLGATQVILRPRPVGFGLRCNPFMHQIMRAAGLKDISAKVWGSRNKLGVIKTTFMMLHSGHAPVGMGDGMGGKGRKLSRGVGMQGQEAIENARGRSLLSLRK